METVQSKDGTTIAYDKLGSGPALVLVSGGSADRQVDAKYATAFAEHFTVYNYDRRGRGDSTDTAPFAVRREIEDLDAVIAAAGEAAVLVAFSSGGALAAQAVLAGSDVSGLVLWEVPFAVDPEGSRQHKEYYDELTGHLAEGRKGDAAALFLQRVGLPDDQIAGMRQAPFWGYMEAVAPTLAYDAAALGDGTVPADRYATITVPTLVLAGGGEFFQAAAAVIHEAVPNSAYKVLEGQTHDVAPEVLVPAVVEFTSSGA